MRKVLVMLCLFLLVAAPALAAPPWLAGPVAADVYMPVGSLSGLFGAKVNYQAANQTITLTMPNNSVAIIYIATGKVHFGNTVYTLKNPIRTNPGTAFVPLNELAGILNNNVRRLPPGLIRQGRIPTSGPVTPPATGQIAFTHPANKGLNYSLTPSSPLVILDRAGDALTTRGSISADASIMILYRGEFTRSGYAIVVESMQIVNGVLTIGVKLTDPPAASFGATVMTYPYDVVVLPGKIPAEVTSYRILSNGQQLATGVMARLHGQ